MHRTASARLSVFHSNPGETRKDTLFGSANVGHDVWTRFLYGGKSILVTAVLATALALILGTIVG